MNSPGQRPGVPIQWNISPEGAEHLPLLCSATDLLRERFRNRTREPLSVIMACINPHRLGLTRSLESALAIKVYRSTVSNKHVLVKPIVVSHEHPHQLCSYAAALVIWEHNQVRIIDDQIAV